MEEKPADDYNYNSRDYVVVKEGDGGTYTEMGGWQYEGPQGVHHHHHHHDDRRRHHDSYYGYDSRDRRNDYRDRRYDDRYDGRYDTPSSDIHIDGGGILTILAIVLVAVFACGAYIKY